MTDAEPGTGTSLWKEMLPEEGDSALDAAAGALGVSVTEIESKVIIKYRRSCRDRGARSGSCHCMIDNLGDGKNLDLESTKTESMIMTSIVMMVLTKTCACKQRQTENSCGASRETHTELQCCAVD